MVQRNLARAWTLQKLLQLLLKDGRRSVARRQLARCLQHLQDLSAQAPVPLLERAVQACRPTVTLRRVRVAGTTYLVPQMLTARRGTLVALRWLLQAAKARRRGTLCLAHCLAQECWEASQGQGGARGRCVETHRLALANRALVRYRWW
jgi:small subunit ribosomal protein S7